MDFKRARTLEQKDQRINQILQVTEELFEEYNYTDITLKMVADKLDYTRGNLYKYFSIKEEIFLLIFKNNLNLWIEDVLKSFDNKDNFTSYEFADLWSKTIDKYHTMLKLHNLLSAIIEENVSFEKLIEFKSAILNDFYRLMPVIKIQLPFLNDDEIKDFLFFQLMHASALYINLISRINQLDALKICDPFFKPMDFYPTFRHFMYTHISGYKVIQK